MSVQFTEDQIQQEATDLATALQTNFTGSQLVDAIREISRPQGTVTLPADDQEFWDKSLGAAKSDKGMALASNAIERLKFLQGTVDAGQVAKVLGKRESTIRHYKADSKLYAFMLHGKLCFPEWQFYGNQPLPGLEIVLAKLPDDVHPQAVDGFFNTPKPELMRGAGAVSPVEWLIEGNDPRRVAELAESLGVIL